MDDRTAIYNLQRDMWRLTEKYRYEKLTDEQWEKFVEDGYVLQEKYRKVNRDIELLMRNMFRAVQEYYVRKKGGSPVKNEKKEKDSAIPKYCVECGQEIQELGRLRNDRNEAEACDIRPSEMFEEERS